jgi:uncharacterized membrane protein YecN with MAPEG domain
VFLSLRVIGQRRVARVSLGDGGNAELQRRCRVHANFAEYVPLALLLMVLAESQGWPDWVLHLVGGPLLVGRAAHAYGVSRAPELPRLRVVGMASTFAAIVFGSLAVLSGALAP